MDCGVRGDEAAECSIDCLCHIARVWMLSTSAAECLKKRSAYTSCACSRIENSLTKWQDGKPYIQQATAHQPYDDPRSQGYTLVARTVFSSKADMDYYDNECEAHTAIKSFIKPKVGGPPLVIYMDA